MDKEKAIIIFNHFIRKTSVDIEVPLNITATELVIGLNEAYDLGINITNIKNCYLKAENPIALLKGDRTLAQYGVRNGTVINFYETGSETLGK